MKSDERSISAIAAQAHNAEADKRTLQKKLAASERRVQRRATYGQKTEGKYNGRNNMTPADEADLNGEEVPESTFDVSDEEFSEPSVLPGLPHSPKAPRTASVMSRSTSMTSSTV